VVDEIVDTPTKLRQVTADDVVRVATQVFEPDARAEFAVRGAVGR
jgi:predicted Zn-dependent peptidase